MDCQPTPATIGQINGPADVDPTCVASTVPPTTAVIEMPVTGASTDTLTAGASLLGLGLALGAALYLIFGSRA